MAYPGGVPRIPPSQQEVNVESTWPVGLLIVVVIGVVVVGIFALSNAIPPRSPIAGYDYPAAYPQDGAVCYVYRDRLSCVVVPR